MGGQLAGGGVGPRRPYRARIGDAGSLPGAAELVRTRGI